MNPDRAICVVDDDDGHAFLLESNLRQAGVQGGIMRFRNGFEAIERLHAESPPDPAGRAASGTGTGTGTGTGAGTGMGMGTGMGAASPGLILLDLNMPGMSGVRVLEKLRAHPLTRTTPVVVLSSSGNPPEIEHCYRLGCNLYLVKPLQYEEFVRMIRLLGEVFQVVKLPGA